MLNYALVFLALAALTGLFLAAGILRGQLATWPVSITHGALGALGLTTVLVSFIAFGERSGRITIALGVLLAAALGGFLLAWFHSQRKLAPLPVVAIHALAAVAGFLALGSFVLGV